MCVLSCLTSCNESNRLWRWCAGSGFSNVGNQKQSGPSGAEQEKEQAVCPSDRVKHAEEARENKSCSKNQKQLKTQSNVPLLCDKIVRMLCTITNRSNCMQAWQYITVTCSAKKEFTSIQYTGIHYALNEIIRQREDNNPVGLIEKCDFEENIFFLENLHNLNDSLVFNWLQCTNV